MNPVTRILVACLAATVACMTLGVAAASASPQSNCPDGSFCAYPSPNFYGFPQIMSPACGSSFGIDFSGIGSWVNYAPNPARGHFKSSDLVTRWTSGTKYDNDLNADWSWVYWIEVC